MSGLPLTSSNNDRKVLPEYVHPPLIAATLGVDFDPPLPDVANNLARLRDNLGAEWRGSLQVKSDEIFRNGLDFGIQPSESFIKNVLGDRVVRLNEGHISFTWLGLDDARYPRYENLRDGFVAVWDAFCHCNSLTVKPYSWAVAYLNRIPQGTVWQAATDWSFFELRPHTESLTSRLLSGQWVIAAEDCPDGVLVDVKRAKSTDSEIGGAIWLKLTVAGQLNSALPEILDGLDFGRSVIVQTFSELLTPHANAYWGFRRRGE